MENLLNFSVMNLFKRKKDGVEKQLVGWLEGYQIRLWPRSWDNVPLFLLPAPHNELLLGPGCISGSSSAPARARGVPTFPGLLGKGCPAPASPSGSSSQAWNEGVTGSRPAGCGPLSACRLQEVERRASC